MFENYPLYTHYTANANPRMYENTTLFFGDIVGFTKLTAQRWKRLCVEMLITFTCCCSTATQTIQFLNDLYNKFDKAIDNYDVYKVWQATENDHNLFHLMAQKNIML